MMIMKIAIIAPRHYIDELQSYYKPREGVDLHYIHEESIQGSSLNKVTRTLLQQNFDGYIGLVDWSSLYSAYLNHRIGAPSPSPELLAKLQDKLLSRKIQNKYIKNRVFAADTRNLKQNINIEWPLFVKPRRASMSYLAEVVEDYEKLESITSENVREKLSVKNKKWKELYDFIDAPKSVAEGIDGFVAEELLMHGIQVTLDGFVQNRKVIFFGFTKSVFLPNHVSFKRFDYPYKFSRKLQRKLNRHARKLIKGSRFNHSLFNIEYKVDLKENKFEIVEINTRPSSQFMTPIEMVMGAHPLDVAIDIVQGKKVKLKLPKKTNSIASVCVFRQECDAIVQKTPNMNEMTWFYNMYPEGKWKTYALEGEQLSDHPNDSRTFRYAEMVVSHNVKLPIHDFEEELKKKFDATIKLINITK